jgi:carboxyl-terminal processing protease
MIRNSLQLPRAVIVSVILGIGLVSGGMLMQSSRLHASDVPPANAQLLDQVMRHIERDYVDSLSEPDLRKRAAEGFVLELDDPYSSLLTPERYRRVQEQTTGRYAGIGVELDQREGIVTVIAPLAGTPAESAGVRAGDQLVTVNGAPVLGLTMDEVEQRLRGPAGSRVQIELVRAGVLDHIKLTLTRRDIQVHAVQHAELLGDSVAYVRFAAFNEHAASELAQAVDSLHGRGMRSLILDLRSNPGGLLDEGVSVADLFLDAGETIVTTRGRTAQDDHEYDDQAAQRWPRLPIVTLVDSGTASAAEIVAGAMQDQRRSVLVGSPTYGKGSAQIVFPVAEGRALKLTTAHWFTPNGRSIQRDSASGGITPDVIAREQSTFVPATDTVVRRAITLLRGVRTPAELKSRVPARADTTDR